jgi:predicted RNase H-like nuclease
VGRRGVRSGGLRHGDRRRGDRSAVRRFEDAERIVVDVPIGLPGPAERPPIDADRDWPATREADALARDAVGPRSSSVFPAPSRPVVEAIRAVDDAPDWATLNTINERAIGKGLPQQSANIAPGVADVDALLDDAGTDAVVEGHPEVAFRAFRGAPLEHSKHAARGVRERIAALRTVEEHADDDWQRAVDDLDPASSVGLDDLLDAIALALTAAAGNDAWRTLPPDPDRDAVGRPMRVAYRSTDPLP